MTESVPGFDSDADALDWYRATYDDEAEDQVVLARLEAWMEGRSDGPDAQGVPRRAEPPADSALEGDYLQTTPGQHTSNEFYEPFTGFMDVCMICGALVAHHCRERHRAFHGSPDGVGSPGSAG